MRFYIATTLSNAERARQVRDRLQAHGHVTSYDWTIHGGVGHLGREALGIAAIGELTGVLSADVVIVLLPGGRGTHAELGMALAASKPIILWDEPGGAFVVDNTTCAFYWHPRVRRFEGQLDDQAIDFLRLEAESLARKNLPTFRAIGGAA